MASLRLHRALTVPRALTLPRALNVPRTTAALAVAVAAALLGGGAAQAYTVRGDVTARAAAAAVASATAREVTSDRVRAESADSARLNGLAVSAAALRSGAALTVARAAVATAHEVAATSSADVAADQLTPLDDARATLAALIVSAAVAPGTLTASTQAAPATSDATSRLLTASRRVIDLSDQIRAVAGANATAAAAARADSVELARKVAGVEVAPNGAVRTSDLCAPAFAPAALLRCDAARALDALDAAYRADHGRNLIITSSYRTLAEQFDVKAQRGDLASVPGRSNHGRGLAVDFAGFGEVGQFSAASYVWMTAHADEFGWSHPQLMEPGGSGPQEPWHWEFGTS